MATVKETPENKVHPKSVTIFQPNDDQNGEYSSPVISHHLTEGLQKVKSISDYSTNTPRLLIVMEDGLEQIYVGMPFIITHRKDPIQSIEDIEKTIREVADAEIPSKPVFKKPQL